MIHSLPPERGQLAKLAVDATDYRQSLIFIHRLFHRQNLCQFRFRNDSVGNGGYEIEKALGR